MKGDLQQQGHGAAGYHVAEGCHQRHAQVPGDKDKPLNNMPVFLVVPPALAIEAARILSSVPHRLRWDSTTGSPPVAQPSRTGIEAYCGWWSTRTSRSSTRPTGTPRGTCSRRSASAAEYASARLRAAAGLQADGERDAAGRRAGRGLTRTASATRCGTCSVAAMPMRRAAGGRPTGATARGRKPGLSIKSGDGPIIPL